MPLSSAIVGRRSDAVDTVVDVRWLMAYASGLGEDKPCYLDTETGIIGHPVFPVCVEWATRQAISPPGPTGLTTDERYRGVHFGHDLLLRRPVTAGLVTTTSEVVAARRHRAGALMVTRIDAVADGEPLWTTWMTSLMRGVELDGPEDVWEEPPAVPVVPAAGAGASGAVAVAGSMVAASASVAIPSTAAHVYTECARIWNPIHTDPLVARAAGLPGIILHGTATLAIGVSRTLDLAGRQPAEVTRVAGSFGAMVLMPSTVEVQLIAGDESGLHFEVRTEEGGLAVRRGYVGLRS